MRIERAMVMMDCLMDTVIGTVRTMNEHEAERLIELGYLKRSNNHLSQINPKINDQLFFDAYAKRDFEVLKKSYTTNIPVLLRANNMAISTLEDDHPEKYELVVILNTWPYLLQDHVVRTFMGEIQKRINPKRVKRIHMPISRLTPKYIKKNFTQFIIPSYAEWIKYHLYELRENQLALVRCIAPEIYLTQQEVDDAYSKKLIKEHYKLDYDKFDLSKTVELVNKGMSTHLNLELLPLTDFSLCPSIEHNLVNQ